MRPLPLSSYRSPTRDIHLCVLNTWGVQRLLVLAIGMSKLHLSKYIAQIVCSNDSWLSCTFLAASSRAFCMAGLITFFWGLLTRPSTLGTWLIGRTQVGIILAFNITSFPFF